MPPNSCKIVVGRLMEIDVPAGYRSAEDIDAMIGMIRREIGKLPAKTPIVIAADWRQCQIFSPSVAERTIAMFAGANDRIERSAILYSELQPTALLQVLRLVREGRAAQRRVFTSPTEMQNWLAEILEEPEKERLATFLGEEEPREAVNER